MDVTMIGLQNAGKTSLLRVLSVSLNLSQSILQPSQANKSAFQGGEFTIE
jgi:ABC-type phosphate/phosphonate transport system ATPase subunit